MTTTTDIAELEGPFEQIAGATSGNESSSSETCTVSFKVTGSLEDHYKAGNYECIIQVELTGCSPDEVSFEVTATPVAPNPQNAAGTRDWKFDHRKATDKLKIYALPIWYGSAPDNLCHGYEAPYDLKIKATCPHGTCESKPVRVKVTLPDASLSSAAVDNPGAGPNGQVYDISEPTAVPGVSNHYNCFATIYGWALTSKVSVDDHLSQYRDLIKAEEEYHIQQFKGKVDFEHGGCGDLWTVDGVTWWLEFVGTQPIQYFGNTPEEAFQNANDAIMAALTREDAFCRSLFNERRPFIEWAAKKAVGFKEAWTFPCAYPEWKNMHFPPYPRKHPAYAP